MLDKLQPIKEAVFLRRPVLGEIAGRYGGQSLLSYVKDCWAVPKFLPDADFLAVLKAQATPLYGSELAEKAVIQLAARPLVSSIDHHGIWGHPFFVNSALIYSLYFGPNDLAITFPTESVSLNNTSSWSGSVLWHSDAAQTRRASFFSDKQKHLPVFSAPALGGADIARFHKKTLGMLGRLLDVLDISAHQSAANFSTQACLMSQNLWRAVFPAAPRLVYFPLETLVMKYLEKVFEDPKHLLSRLVLTKEGRELWRKFFGNEHTFMFWGVDAKGRRVSLSEFAQPTSDILKWMRGRQIYPSSPLCFAVLLYAGFACVGGFTQTTWLTQVKEKFISLLSELENIHKNSLERIQALATKNFAESSLAWLSVQDGYFTPTAVDLFLTGKNYYQVYKNLAQKLSLEQSLDLALPTIYQVVGPKIERAGQPGFDELQQEIFKKADVKNILEKCPAT